MGVRVRGVGNGELAGAQKGGRAEPHGGGQHTVVVPRRIEVVVQSAENGERNGEFWRQTGRRAAEQFDAAEDACDAVVRWDG